MQTNGDKTAISSNIFDYLSYNIAVLVFYRLITWRVSGGHCDPEGSHVVMVTTKLLWQCRPEGPWRRFGGVARPVRALCVRYQSNYWYVTEKILKENKAGLGGGGGAFWIIYFIYLSPYPVCMSLIIYKYIHTHTHTCVYTSYIVFVNICIYIYIYIYVFIYVYIYIYISTYLSFSK